MSFLQKKNPIDSLHIHMAWLESCSSLAENGLLGKDSNIGEFKTFCANVALPVTGSLLRWRQCFLSLVAFPFISIFNKDDWRLVKSINVLV